MASYDFTSVLGDRFGGFLNESLDVVKAYGEHQLQELQVKNASVAQYQYSQQAQPVNNNGQPVQSSETIAGIRKSTLLYVGGFMLLAGAGVALYKSAT